jgi:hypothetical protein
MDEIEKDGLRNPYAVIVEDMVLNESDAAFMASFVDTTVIVKAMKKIKYSVKTKIALLGKVIGENTEATIPQQLAAMKQLDEIIAHSLASQGIIVRAAPGVSADTTPLGLPQAQVSSVEMTEKSVKMTMANSEQLDGMSEADVQPLVKENKNDSEEIGQDKFYEDDRSKNPQIFRAAQGEAVRAVGPAIG